MSPAETDGFAPAKINLALHVTGRRADGYHLLDSIVAFAATGDRVTVRPDDRLTLEVSGPQAAKVPQGDGNLVLRAARMMARGRGARILLDKHLPVAAGIGGGSSDAAATLRALASLWSEPLPPQAEVLTLGADVPVCLAGRACRMQGIGESLTPVLLPPAAVVLANPGVALETGPVFAALDRRDNPPLPDLPAWRDAAELAQWLGQTRNDLERPARRLLPALDDVLAALAAQPGAFLARMSGSGATCFALFANREAAARACAVLRRAAPGWWVADAPLLAPAGAAA